MTFTKEELEHIKSALMILYDINITKIQKEGDRYDQDAALSTEIILKIKAGEL